ncbi:hypothetical protein [Sutcliffiella halmapala]|uniref:hypothetical protein n=1 Tax=Sutcliffiella halmapala TaxID=79882 RepID=UPI0009959264|nr:hypothetical protein [Sutcliffiella halmapala]
MLQMEASKTVTEKIKNHKQFLEKADMWNYAFQDNGKLYIIVQYIRLNKINGTLILTSEGEEVSKEEAIKFYQIFNRYNSIVHGGIAVMIPEMQKSYTAYEDLLRDLEDYKEALLMEASDKELVHNYIESVHRVVQTRRDIPNIVYGMRDLQNKILDEQGYFTEADLHQMQQFGEDFNRVQFIFAVEQLEKIDMGREVLRLLQNIEKKDNRLNKLIKNLDYHLSDRSMDVLRKAHKEQTKAFDGREKHYSPDEKGIEEMLENYRDIVKQSTESKLSYAIRNK